MKRRCSLPMNTLTLQRTASIPCYRSVHKNNSCRSPCHFLRRSTPPRRISGLIRPPRRLISQELPGLSEARVVDGISSDDIPPAAYKFRLYSGKMLELFSENLYRLDGQLCKGAYTGDDFCNVSRFRIGLKCRWVPVGNISTIAATRTTPHASTTA